MLGKIINPAEINDISSEVLRDDGKIKLLPSELWKKYKWDDFRAFCHFHARYGIPTLEQNIFLCEVLDGRNSIEIGAGAGDLGFHLNIKMTDSKQQELSLVKKAYYAMKQPVIKYPTDVEKIDALKAVYKYKPKVVVASWITPYSMFETKFASNPMGVKEPEILDLVDTLIIIGNLDTHRDKPILKQKHEEYYFDWIVSRGKNQENNRIWIWDKKL